MKFKHILIVGIGSIGKKHIQVLKKIDKKTKILKISKNVSFKEINNLINFYKIKIAIISSPADTHLKYINFFKKKRLII